MINSRTLGLVGCLVSVVACGGDTLEGLAAECQRGYENVGNGCEFACDDGFRADGEECVAICPAGFEWTGQQCQSVCADDRAFEDGACVCLAGFEAVGDDCLTPCGEDLVRIDGICDCAAGTQLVGELCMPPCAEGTVRIGGECAALGIVTGSVCDQAQGQWRSDVTVTMTLNDGTELTDTTDIQGAFELEGIPAGAYYVNFAGPAGFSDVQFVEVTAGQVSSLGNADCLAPPGHLRGSVCDDSNGIWVQNAVVTLDDLNHSTTTTDLFGAFMFFSVPVGNYNVTIDHPNGTQEVRPAAVVSGIITDLGPTACAEPAGELRGAVCDTVTGTWVAGAAVSLNDAANSSTTSDSTGAWTFADLDAGAYDVTVNYAATSVVTAATVTPGQVTDLSPGVCVPADLCTGGTPLAAAGPDQTAIPDQVVNLDGTGSTDPSGTVNGYNWRIASRPTGSVSALSSTTAATPNLLADVSGAFSVCLSVTDNDACTSQEDCMTIDVAPQVAFHIELTWDIDDADVDLHYKRPSANWFAGCLFGNGGDNYFGCMNPDWGPSGFDGNAANDPSLDVDNLFGYGPENINQDELYDAGPFEIGVHYWADKGGGNARPRIRVYVAGALQYEAIATALVCGEMWKVAQITVSGNGTQVFVTPIDTRSNEGCH